MLDWFKRIGAPARNEQPSDGDKMVERLMDRLAVSGRSEEPAPVFAVSAEPPVFVMTGEQPVFAVADEPPVDDEILELSHDMKVERLADHMPAAEPKVERLPARAAAAVKPAQDAAAGSSQMRIVAVASQKGGCGKTTIAAHLAVRAGMVGQGPAVLVDTDPQRSLTEWWQARGDDSLALATAKLDDLPGSLAQLRGRGAAVAIIDTPPALTSAIEQVIALADLVLIPARPSPHDLRAIGATVEMTRRAGKPFVFVVNGAAPRASITAEAVAALSEHGRVAPGILYQRTDFAASMIDGRTVMETAPNSRSTQEIAELWKCVYAHISMRAAA